MTNAYASLKAEIVRIARKEVRGEIAGLKQTVVLQRAAISAMKKEVATLEQAQRQTSKSAKKALTAVTATTPAVEPVQRRFSPARLAAHRQKLGVSAASYGRLVGMSGAIVYLWEKGEVRPSADVVDALAKLKKLTKTQIEERLQQT